MRRIGSATYLRVATRSLARYKVAPAVTKFAQQVEPLGDVAQGSVAAVLLAARLRGNRYVERRGRLVRPKSGLLVFFVFGDILAQGTDLKRACRSIARSIKVRKGKVCSIGSFDSLSEFGTDINRMAGWLYRMDEGPPQVGQYREDRLTLRCRAEEGRWRIRRASGSRKYLLPCRLMLTYDLFRPDNRALGNIQ